MKRSKLIAILLFLLLILIILCTWCHSDDIANQRAATLRTTPVTTIPINEVVKKTSIDYSLKKANNTYELTGNFSTTKDIEKIHSALGIDEFQDTSNINKDLEGNEEALSLTEEIIPLLVNTYSEGSIQYRNNKLTIEGTVENNEDRDRVNALLENSTIATENNTDVVFVPTEPIQFKVSKKEEALALQGLFQSQEEANGLKERLNSDTLLTNIKVDDKLMSGKNVIHVTKTLIDALKANYSNGSITYTEELLTVEGSVDNEEAKAQMEALLQASGFKYHNNTIVTIPSPSKETLEAQKLAEEKAKAEKAKEEALKLAEEKANAEKLAKEKAQKEALAIEAEIKNIIDLENINFAVNKAQLTPESLTTLNHIAAILQQHTSIIVEIGGHTDSDGNDNYNLTLSQKRVDTVKQKLVDLGISANRLMAVGYGETQPLVSNDTKENKRLNRRVVFKVKGE